MNKEGEGKMTNEQRPEDEGMTGGEPAVTPAPGADAPTTVTPLPPPPLAPLVDQAQASATAPMAAAAASQPVVAWQAAPPQPVAVKGKRTVLAAIAGILLLLGGLGGILLGLLIAVVGGTFVSGLGQFTDFGDIPELNGADPAAVLGGVVTFVGIIIAAYSVAYLLAGIGVLRNSSWARVLGIVVGILSGLIWLSGVTNANQIRDTASAGGSIVFAIIMLAIHVYIVAALLFFWRTKPSTA